MSFLLLTLSAAVLSNARFLSLIVFYMVSDNGAGEGSGQGSSAVTGDSYITNHVPASIRKNLEGLEGLFVK